MITNHCLLRKLGVWAPTLLAALAIASAGAPDTGKSADPLMIQEQGSFAVGGTVLTNAGAYDAIHRSPAGQTLHGDHAYVFYQVPVGARRLPLVFWHGIGQFTKTWETTPDGREGFQNIFLRRGFPVYVVHQPRRGHAGRSTLPATITPVPDEQDWFGTFRLGIWPDFFPGVQFSRDPEALNQYFRQITPDTGPLDPALNAAAITALFKKVGPGISISDELLNLSKCLQKQPKETGLLSISASAPGDARPRNGREIHPEQHLGVGLDAEESLWKDWVEECIISSPNTSQQKSI